MKKFIFLPFLFLQLQSHSSGILVGLKSENLISWNVWEKNLIGLKHELLLFNKGGEPINVEIRLKRFRHEGTIFIPETTDKIFYQISLDTNKLAKLNYPEKTTDLDFMEYFENGKSIGLMEISEDKPDKSFIKNKYNFYSEEGANSGKLGFWVGLESINDANSAFELTTKTRYENDYYLLKVLSDEKDSRLYFGKLDSLMQMDNTIMKLDKICNTASSKIKSEFKQKTVLFLFIHYDYVADLRTLKDGKPTTEKSVGGGNCRIPIFKKTG